MNASFTTHYDWHQFDQEMFDQAAEVMEDSLGLMIEAYQEDSATYFETILKAVTAQDADSLAKSAHPLKSSSASLGLVTVGDAARDLEKAAIIMRDHEQGSWEDIAQMAYDLEAGHQIGLITLQQSYDKIK